MTPTEATSLKNALTKLSKSFQSTANIQLYIQHWKADIDANADGIPNTVEDITGDAPVGIFATTVAVLPPSPNTGDEAIVTDASSPVTGSPVVGGGAVRVMVTWNGSNWVVE